MAATTPIRSSTAARRGNKNASSAMEITPIRRVDAIENAATVVTSKATVRANIGKTPDVLKAKMAKTRQAKRVGKTCPKSGSVLGR